LSSRPLVFGLIRQRRPEVELVYAGPGQLAEALARSELDAALIPSIEFLRGVGSSYVGGPALIARGRTGSQVLVTDKPLEEIRRVAVDEMCRTPLAAMRIVLDRLYGAMPDFCVHKADPMQWREDYDAVLLAGDNGLDYCSRGGEAFTTCYDIGEMWWSLYPLPLVMSLWAYNDVSLGDALEEILVESRDFAMDNLTLLSSGVARTSPYDEEFLYEYFNNGWGYEYGRKEEEGLKLLEEGALEYQLIQEPRLAGTLSG
jgi:chorismate dehydratase